MLTKIAATSDNSVKIPNTLSADGALNIIQAKMNMSGRTLTTSQINAVKEAFKKCSSPIYVNLIFKQVKTWNSYNPPKTLVLETSVEATVNILLSRLEQDFGKVLIERVLCYIACACHGITDSELLDVLSLDNDVLDENGISQHGGGFKCRVISSIEDKADIELFILNEDGITPVKILVVWLLSAAFTAPPVR